MTNSKDPMDVFYDSPLDIFHLYFGILRDTIKKVDPETWKSLLNQNAK